NERGRQAIPELELEVALLDDCIRFWHKGELLGLPAELVEEIDDLKARIKEAKKRATQEKRRADQEKQRADREKQRAGEEAKRRIVAEAELARLRALHKSE